MNNCTVAVAEIIEPILLTSRIHIKNIQCRPHLLQTYLLWLALAGYLCLINNCLIILLSGLNCNVTFKWHFESCLSGNQYREGFRDSNTRSQLVHFEDQNKKRSSFKAYASSSLNSYYTQARQARCQV